MRKIFSIQDLRNYLQKQNKTLIFSTEAGDPEIVVGVPASLQFSDDKSTQGLLPVTLRACHDKDNLNGSEISKSDMKKALKSFRNRPILGYIHKDDNGDYQFAGHEMHLSSDDEIVYDEVPVGHTIGAAKLEYDADYDKDFVVIDDAVIYEEYSEAANILRREEKCDVSVELSIREMSYDAEKRLLQLKDFYCSGITILGYNDDGKKVNPAMPGSNISLKDFSTTTDTKGDNNMNKFDELLAKYEKTAEDIDFDYSSLSDEELEAKFAELFGENSTEPSDETEPVNDEPADDTDGEKQFSDNRTDSAKDSDNHTITYSVNNKNFEISLNDIQYALSELVNNQYSETDGTWYTVNVYQDSKSVVMVDYWTGKAYRQSYKVRNNEYSLTGDRVEVFAQYLTQDEIAAVDDMRSKYEVASEKLTKYEEEPKKLDILNSTDYSAVADSAEFEELKKPETHFDMSVEEVTNKANEILLDYAKKNSQNFEKKTTDIKVRPFPEPPKYSKKKGRYSNLFSKD